MLLRICRGFIGDCFRETNTSMRALCWDKQSCSHNVSQNKFNVSGAFLTKRKVLGRGVQTCVLEKEKSFFRDPLFAARIGKLVGFAGPPGRSFLIESLCRAGFFMLKFLETVFR